MLHAKQSIPIEVSNRGGRGVAVYLQDQTTGPLDLPFLRFRANTTITADTAVGDYTVTLASGHGTVIGNTFEIADLTNGSYFMQATVLNVVGDVITLDTPINRIYTVANSAVVLSDCNMNVDGSVTPIIFSVEPLSIQSGDITRLIATMTIVGTDMDFEGFGGLAALTKGLVLRVKNGDGTYRNIQNFKTNGDLENFSFDRQYFTNKAGGTRGFSSRMTFAGQEKHGVAIRLDGALSEGLELIVQDDLTGLASMNWLAQGSELQE